ncbi:uncharacterized protein LOC6533281 [Drosophila yakuba]|uniref:Uncharacterized protein n=1 Tax=Drosophila yakuba TaxID=7245 RepID=B4PK39_DROYA|nr:uncharacterized protein LOC6533281 [Drosophila yakuba]EDW93719.1 uncharacterized protein Dyak_GE21599 [Drosophila yakuba]
MKWTTGLLLAVGLLTLPSPGLASRNLTEFMGHRQKRWLIYQNSGSMKFSIGPSMPIPLGDKVSFRSCVLSFTLQGGSYSLPTSPIWPWDKWEGTFARSLTQMRKNIERHVANGGVRYADDARLLVYTALEEYIGRSNNDHSVGRQCLLRSICENAQIHHHIGVFSEIMDIVLSPGKADVDNAYHEAYAAGRAGANCLGLYRTCPRGINFLDGLLIAEDD